MDALETEETSGTIHVGISSVKGDAGLLVKVLPYPLLLSSLCSFELLGDHWC